MDEQHESVTNVTLSWLIPWVAGWLFTLGYVGIGDTIIDLASIPVTFILWPMLLGRALG